MLPSKHLPVLALKRQAEFIGLYWSLQLLEHEQVCSKLYFLRNNHLSGLYLLSSLFTVHYNVARFINEAQIRA